MTNNNDSTTMTVGDLIAALQKFDPALPVEMAMNQEYQWAIRPSDITLDTRNGSPYVLIGD